MQRSNKFTDFLLYKILPGTLWAVTLLMVADRVGLGLRNFGVGNVEVQYRILKEEREAQKDMLHRLLPNRDDG